MSSFDGIHAELGALYDLEKRLEVFRQDIETLGRGSLNDILNSVEYFRGGVADSFRERWQSEFERLSTFISASVPECSSELRRVIAAVENISSVR